MPCVSFPLTCELLCVRCPCSRRRRRSLSRSLARWPSLAKGCGRAPPPRLSLWPASACSQLAVQACGHVLQARRITPRHRAEASRAELLAADSSPRWHHLRSRALRSTMASPRWHASRTRRSARRTSTLRKRTRFRSASRTAASWPPALTHPTASARPVTRARICSRFGRRKQAAMRWASSLRVSKRIHPARTARAMRRAARARAYRRRRLPGCQLDAIVSLRAVRVAQIRNACARTVPAAASAVQRRVSSLTLSLLAAGIHR